MAASPFVYGSGYDQIAQQQMGLDQATTNRMLASQQMLREVQRAAVAQRQQEIATYQQAQALADQQAQRDQENQYRMAALIADYQNRNRSDARYRDETTYNRGQDKLASLFRDKQFASREASQKTADAFDNTKFLADLEQNKTVNKLRQDEFDDRKSQLTNAEIVDKRRREEAAIQDQNQMNLAKSVAEAMNQVKSSQDVLTELGTSPGKPSWLGKGDMRELYSRLPYDMPVDPKEYLGDTGFFSTPYPKAIETLRSLYQARMAPFQSAVKGYQAAGGDALVGIRPNGQAYPNFIPRTLQSTNAPSTVVDPVVSARAQVRHLMDQGIDLATAARMVSTNYPARKY